MATPARLATSSLALALALALFAPAPARAQKKPKPACGIQYLPLVEGNQWTYEPMASPAPQNEDEKKRLQILNRLTPKPPKQVDVKVLSVVPQDQGITEITLQEISTEQNDQKVEKKTVLHCTNKTLQIDPQSFFFSGEPGGGLLMELSNLTWDGSFPGRQGWRRADKWLIKVTGDLKRGTTEGTGAVLSDGKIEIERAITVGPKERLATASGSYNRAQGVWFVMSGRAAVGPDLDKSLEIPLGENGILWFEDRVGMVQSKNRSGQWYQLVDKKLN